MRHSKKLVDGLKFLGGYEPPSGFRYESGVSLGECEIHQGCAFGLHSYMNSGLVRSQVIVGRYCSIGRNVIIGSGSHDFGALSTSPVFKKNSNPPVLKYAHLEKKIRVKIGHDVWVGDNAYIMSGITIGDGAIIASGSVVTKNVPPYAIVGGIPAKVIKMRFTQELIFAIQAVRWFDFTPDQLQNIDIGNIAASIDEVGTWPESSRRRDPDYTNFNANSIEK